MAGSILKSSTTQPRMVRGSLFLDYVRIVKRARALHSARLWPEDRECLAQPVVPDQWYPMATFERLGLVIIDSFMGVIWTDDDARDEPADAAGRRAGMLTVNSEPIRMFGRHQIPAIAAQFPELVVPKSPRETLMRFRVLLSSFFDFPALDMLSINDTSAEITIDFGMSPPAERAAAFQTLGFFEALLAMAGAPHHHCELVQRSWEVPGRPTRLRLAWVDARRPRPRKTGPADVPPEELAKITFTVSRAGGATLAPDAAAAPAAGVVEPSVGGTAEPSGGVSGELAGEASAPIELGPQDRKDRKDRTGPGGAADPGDPSDA